MICQRTEKMGKEGYRMKGGQKLACAGRDLCSALDEKWLLVMMMNPLANKRGIKL